MIGLATQDSQPEVLMARMEEKGITHAGELRVDISNVRVGKGEYPISTPALAKLSGKAKKTAPVFFCNVPEMKINKILRDGDGKPIPDQVVVEGLEVEEPGFYTLVNARIFSNGHINVVVDAETQVIPVA